MLVRHDADVQQKRMCIVTALNFYEEVSIAVLKKTANEERLREFFVAIVQQSFTKLEEWIKFERLSAKWKDS